MKLGCVCAWLKPIMLEWIRDTPSVITEVIAVGKKTYSMHIAPGCLWLNKLNFDRVTFFVHGDITKRQLAPSNPTRSLTLIQRHNSNEHTTDPETHLLSCLSGTHLRTEAGDEDGDTAS